MENSKMQLRSGIPNALQIVTTLAYSQLRLLKSYQQIHRLWWPLSFQAFKSSPNQNHQRKQLYSKKPGRRKAQLFKFRGVSSTEPVYGYCEEDFEENIYKSNRRG